MGKAQMFSPKTAWSDTHLTEPALVKALGPFDVDPCCPEDMPWRTARRMITPRRDGLKTSWGEGRAWMNPPYRDNLPWALKFVQHGSGICLLNGRSTQTKSTQHVMKHCAGVFLFARRLTFYKADGTPHKGKWFASLAIGMTDADVALMALLPNYGFPGVLLVGPALAAGYP